MAADFTPVKDVELGFPEYRVDIDADTAEFIRQLRRNIVMKYIVPPPSVTEWRYMKFRHVTIYGAPESGKTTAALTFARYSEAYSERVGLDFVAIRGLTLKACIDALTGVKIREPVYLYLLVDDAEAANPSLRTKKSWNVVKVHNNIRHFLEHMGIKRGLVVVVYSTQRFHDLERVARLSHVTVFKSVQVNDPSEENFYLNFLGSEAFRKLKEITHRIYSLYDDTAKSLYIARELTGRVVGDRLPGIARPRRLIDVWNLDQLVEEAAGEPVPAPTPTGNYDIQAIPPPPPPQPRPSSTAEKLRLMIAQLDPGTEVTPSYIKSLLAQIGGNPALSHVYIKKFLDEGLLRRIKRGVYTVAETNRHQE